MPLVPRLIGVHRRLFRLFGFFETRGEQSLTAENRSLLGQWQQVPRQMDLPSWQKPLHLVFKMDLNSVISPPASKQWEGRHWTCCSFAREDPMVDPFGSNGPQFVLTWIEVLNRCPERPSLASSAVRWPEWKRGKRTPCLEWCSGCGFREWPRKGRGFGTGSEAVEVA